MIEIEIERERETELNYIYQKKFIKKLLIRLNKRSRLELGKYRFCLFVYLCVYSILSVSVMHSSNIVIFSLIASFIIIIIIIIMLNRKCIYLLKRK